MRPEVEDEQRSVRQWRMVLMSFFLRRVPQRAEAEDLTQEVLARLLQHSAREDTEQPSDGYVFQVAANLLRDRARRGKVRDAYSARQQATGFEAVDPLDPYRFASDREALALLERAIAELPERTRTIFILYRMEKIDKVTIANSLGISVSAVTQHLVKAMRQLTARVGPAR